MFIRVVVCVNRFSIQYLDPVAQNLGRTSRSEAAAAGPSSRLPLMVDNRPDDLLNVCSLVTSAVVTSRLFLRS